MTLPVDHIHNLDSYVTNEGEAFESVAGADSVKMDLWVPSECVSVHLIDVPTAPKRKWPELIPWMLEDRLLQPVEEIHFVITGHRVEGQLQVIALSQRDLQEWQRVTENAGVLARSMYPDYLALPWEAGRISVGWRDGICLVRQGATEGFAASPDVTWAMINNLLAQEDNPPRLSLSIPDLELVPEHLRQLADINDAKVDWQFAELPLHCNLLTGDFKSTVPSDGLFGWLPAAALGVLSVVLSTIYIQLASANMAEQIDVLETQLTQGYSRLFEGRRPEPQDVRDEVEQQIELLFAQRQSLSSAPVAGLVALDKLMADCGCQLRSLSAKDQELVMQIENGAALKERVLNIPGYQVAIQAGKNDNAIELRLTSSAQGVAQ
ncbi:MAG: type II secretion system protein GspL [Porticoccaceae bacterium]|nr:type II secretion system protein GspL [Porticoccaceae bacterium]